MGILLLELVDGDCVWNGFNQASCWTSSNNIERFKPQLKFMCIEDSLELLDHLRSKLFLSEVIRTLYDDRH